jgi:dTDP-4-amino-4,6-dideoxygalactose transaminase
MEQNEHPILEEAQNNIVLFTPHIPKNAEKYISKTLQSRWLGQGPQVERFENEFLKLVNADNGIAVGSGTDALHLSYILAGIKSGDEVIVPVFTCTATNIPLLYLGAKIVFADIDPSTMNIDPKSVENLITKKTKAIVCVHYGGLPCDMKAIKEIALKYNLVIIEDAAHAVGAEYLGQLVGNISDFTMFSFQAIKHITTGDGGFLTFKDSAILDRAKQLRWFGIDRTAKQLGIWENDIQEIGFKYQMTDLSASLGLAGIEEFEETLNIRRNLYLHYNLLLSNIDSVQVIGKEDSIRKSAAWLYTICVNNRKKLQEKLWESGIESRQVHYRNDRYSIFKQSKSNFPVMDEIEDKYLVLPLHTKMNLIDVERIVRVIDSGW